MCVLFLVLLNLSTSVSLAQTQTNSEDSVSDDGTVQAIRLDELDKLLRKKIEQRDVLSEKLAESPEGTLIDERKSLQNINRDIANLTDTFELIALSNTDISFLDEPKDTEVDWRQDLLDILKPLVDSLKSVTKRPRQIADLRDTLYVNESRLDVTGEALEALAIIPVDDLDEGAARRLASLVTKWTDENDQLHQERLLAHAQLDRLTEDQQTFFQGIWPATQAFLLGRGLTLLIAILAAVSTWALMRMIWWFYTTRFTTKDQRRNSTWFRLAAYSFYLLTSIVVLFVVMVVLYIRQDLLLLALAFLLIAGAVLSFRQFLPRYVREARLLLNLGSVREDERVVYNGLPWQVKSLNLHSVLRNPALDGVIRLPLEIVSTLVSRPVKNNLWFPSNRGDYVILPDGLLGKIKHQTPDLVEISVRGGMSMTYNTADFYAINLINLTRDETFGVSVTFGLDYSLQNVSLDEIPEALNKAIHSAMEKSGYKKQLKNLIVELATANASSLDFLVWVTLDSAVAGDYYKLERLLLQTCVAVSNEQGWTIPFPQLTVHSPATVSKTD